MRLQIVKSKNAQSLYVIKTVYNNKKRTNKVIEKLGTYENLRKKLYPNEPIEWAKKYVEELNRQEQEGTRNIIVKYNPTRIIEKDTQKLYNGGYLFLEKIYYELGINKIWYKKELEEKYTATQIIDTLRNMNLIKHNEDGYIPVYTRTDITDDLH